MFIGPYLQREVNQSINQYLFLATTPRDFLSKKGL